VSSSRHVQTETFPTVPLNPEANHARLNCSRPALTALAYGYHETTRHAPRRGYAGGRDAGFQKELAAGMMQCAPTSRKSGSNAPHRPTNFEDDVGGPGDRESEPVRGRSEAKSIDQEWPASGLLSANTSSIMKV
jgi:hypothetical protein